MKKILRELRLIFAHELMALALKVLPYGDEREDFAYLLFTYMQHRLDEPKKAEEQNDE